MRRPDGTFEKMITLDNSTICVQSFEDEVCTVPSPDGDSTGCKERRPIDQCGNSSSVPSDWSRVSDFCVEASTPQGEFVHPVVVNLVSQFRLDCQDETGGSYEFTLLPDSSACLDTAVTVEGTGVVAGSTRGYCDGSILTLEAYSDSECNVPVFQVHRPPVCAIPELQRLFHKLRTVIGRLLCSAKVSHRSELQRMSPQRRQIQRVDPGP